MSEEKSIYDRVMEYSKNAPQAFTGYGPSPNFGKASMTPYIVSWNNKNKIETPLSEWKGDIGSNTMELWFEVDLQEFNANLGFNYSRKVRVEVNKVGKDGTVEKKTDWSETVLPSLLEVFGEDWSGKINGTYVEVIDEPSNDKPWHKKVDGVEQFNDDGSPKMVQPQTVKFLRRFANKGECLAAHNERYSGKTAVDNAATEIPDELVSQAQTLRSMFPNMSDEDFAVQYLEGPGSPFAQYDSDAILVRLNKIP